MMICPLLHTALGFSPQSRQSILNLYPSQLHVGILLLKSCKKSFKSNEKNGMLGFNRMLQLLQSKEPKELEILMEKCLDSLRP
mmetsp:Transcript_11596/g.24119  ORF Transcript_11596/g.24119 Transcript_11596/m.24119 type:complete len:83 (-) Transcript_11596:32-280(-)